jgi:hypothetical protein
MEEVSSTLSVDIGVSLVVEQGNVNCAVGKCVSKMFTGRRNVTVQTKISATNTCYNRSAMDVILYVYT